MTVRLRRLAAGDFRRIYDWQRDPSLYEHLVGNRRDVTWPEAETWMTGHWLREGPDRRFALCVGPDDRHVGNVYLLDDPEHPGTYEFHVFIGSPDDRGRGFGRAAVAQALDIAFTELGADAVRLWVLERNARARHLYAEAGFRETVDIRVVEKPDGQARVLSMRLSRDDYSARRAGAR